MPKAVPILASFNGGELSPRLGGRVDFEKYASGCRTLENFILTTQGPARSRPGTRYVDDAIDTANRSWLARFEFSYDQSFVLEFNDDTLAFFTDRGRLLHLGSPYTVTTPYTSAGLVNGDDAFALSLVQVADLVYIAGGSKPPQKLSRLGNTNWTIAEYQPVDGPWLDQNVTEATTVYSDAQTGSVTLTASSSIFTANHVGALIRLEVQNLSKVRPWEPGKTITANELRRADGKTYKAVNSSKTGTVRPTHTKGKAYDGSDTAEGVEWDFQDPGYGIARIAGYTSGTVVTATVLKQLPDGVCTGAGTTWRWTFGAWGLHNEYPQMVTLWRDRIIWLGSRTTWMSVAGDYDSLSPDDVGQQTTESAITVTPASAENNTIRWVQPLDLLLVGTAGAEFGIGPQTDADPIGPANIKAPRKSAFGGRNVRSVSVGDAVLFIDKSGRRLREVRIDAETGAYSSRDVTVLADHVLRGGVVDMAYQAAPDSIVWAVRSDGTLAGFTYEAEQNVYGWCRHALAGAGIVESVACIPAPDGSIDDVWLVVRRTVDGATVRHVEYVTAGFRTGDDPEDAVYLDASLSYDGAPATTISGIDHLEGETVGVVVDGATHPDRVVASGAITLQVAASVVHVGLKYRPRLKTMRLEAGAANGTAQGKIKRSSRITLRLIETLGGWVGTDFDDMDELQFRYGNDAMDAPPALFSGDIDIDPPQGWETDCCIAFEQRDPLPCTVAAIIPRVNTSDGS